MSSYFILTEVPCLLCKGTGIVHVGSYDSFGIDHNYSEDECSRCKGKGDVMESILLTQSILRNLPE